MLSASYGSRTLDAGSGPRVYYSIMTRGALCPFAEVAKLAELAETDY